MSITQNEFKPHQGQKLNSLSQVCSVLQHRFDWLTSSYLIITHLIALLSVFAVYNRPESLSLFSMLIYLLTHITLALFSITAYAHRLVSHRATIKISPMVHICFGYLGQTLAVQGSLASWAGQHRVHHAVDGHDRHEEDPYSAIWFKTGWQNFLWSHVLCYFYKNPYQENLYIKREDKILRQHPFMKAQHTYYILFLVICNYLLPFTTGCLLSGTFLGGIYMVWVSILSAVIVQNITWSVNSFTHLWGIEAAKSSAKNNFFWLLPMGEGNHHADHHDAPTDYRNGFGLLGWLSDPTRYLILCLRWARLVGPLQKTSRAVELKVTVERHMQRVKKKLDAKQRDLWNDYESKLTALKHNLYDTAKLLEVLKREKRALILLKSEHSQKQLQLLLEDLQYKLDLVQNELKYNYRCFKVELKESVRRLRLESEA